MLQIVKAEIVLAPFEAVIADNGLLSSLSWNIVVVDDRKRVKSTLAKALPAIKELDCKHRILLSQGDLALVCPLSDLIFSFFPIPV